MRGVAESGGKRSFSNGQKKIQKIIFFQKIQNLLEYDCYWSQISVLWRFFLNNKLKNIKNLFRMMQIE